MPQDFLFTDFYAEVKEIWLENIYFIHSLYLYIGLFNLYAEYIKRKAGLHEA